MPKRAPGKTSPPEKRKRGAPPVDRRQKPEKPEEQPAEASPEVPKEAELDLRVRGGASAVQQAAGRLSGREDGREEEEEPLSKEEQDENDRILKLLQDPNNQVVVQRVFPREHRGELERYQLPLELDQIVHDIFTRFGGKIFRLSIHPSGPAGLSKCLAAFPLENPNCNIALEAVGQEEDDDDTPQRRIVHQRPGHPGGNTDPYATPISPLTAVRKSIEEKTALTAEKLRLQQAQAELAELREEVEGRRKGEDPELARMRHERDAVQNQMNQTQVQIAELKALVAGGQNKGNDNVLLIELMKNSQAQFTAMMTAMQNSNAQMMTALSNVSGGRKDEDNLDTMLDKLAKFKDAFGPTDSRVSRMEELMFEMAMEKMNEGAKSSEDEQDTVQFAIKQLTPVLKNYVDKKLDQQGGPPISEAEKKKLYDQAARQAAKELAEKWQKEGRLVKVPTPGAKPGLPAPKKQAPKQQPQASASQEGKPKQDPNAGTEQEVQVEPMDLSRPGPSMTGAPQTEPEPEEEEGDMDVPPGPKENGYDRRRAVDFIIDITIGDIVNGCPADTYLVGDILDRLDDEMLEQFLKISSGEELEGLFAPHADPTKIQRIKELGQDERVKSWLTRVVVTAQDERRNALKKA